MSADVGRLGLSGDTNIGGSSGGEKNLNVYEALAPGNIRDGGAKMRNHPHGICCVITDLIGLLTMPMEAWMQLFQNSMALEVDAYV